MPPSPEHPTADEQEPAPPIRPPGLVLRPLHPHDLRATARLHRDHLDTGLFPRLGTGFLARWHQTFLTCPHGWGAVVVDGEGVVHGFVLVATDAGRYRAEVLDRHRVPLALAGSAALLRRPRVLVHFVRTRAVRYARQLLPLSGKEGTRGTDPTAPRTPSETDRVGVVHAVVTSGPARGRGLGRALLAAAADACRADGADRLALVTTDLGTEDPETAGRGDERAGGAPPATGFYEHLGWSRGSVRERDGRRSVQYDRPLR